MGTATTPQASYDFTVLAPVYNESAGIVAFYEALVAVLDTLDYTFEILLVDSSTDDSYAHITALTARDPRVRGLSLSRNFGHQVALSAGMDHARGDAVIMMDADLQHPPEVIPQLIEQYELGYDVVYTIRINTREIGLFKRASSALLYRFFNAVADVRIEPAAADFRLMGRAAVEAYRRFSERGRFMRGLVQWMGFKQSAVTFEVAPRYAGESKYTFRKLVLFALDGVTAFSSKPLRITFGLGVVLLVLALIYASYAVYIYASGLGVPGWASLLVSVLIIGAVQLLSIGVLGEYIARIFDEVKQRPLYFVQQDTQNDSPPSE